jgi:hypothetical protein
MLHPPCRKARKNGHGTVGEIALQLPRQPYYGGLRRLGGKNRLMGSLRGTCENSGDSFGGAAIPEFGANALFVAA